MQAGKNKQIPVLTGIRALAAYLVFLHHFFSSSHTESGFSSGNIFNYLHIGVSLFFVLSGFLIHHNYHAEFSSGLAGLRAFLLHRFARIMPLFLVLTVFTFLVLPFVEDRNSFEWLSLFVLNLSLLKGFLPDALFSGIPQAWSLTVEFCFYLLAPFLFYHLRNRAAWYLLAGLILFTMAFMLNGFSDVLPNRDQFMLTYTFPGRCLEFFAGCILSILFSNGYRKSFSYPAFTLSGTVGIALVPALLSNPAFSLPDWFGIMVLHLLLPIFIAVFFFGLLSEHSVIRSFFSTEILQILGRISFAFYLVHVGVVERGLSVFVSDNILVLFLLLNGIAWLLYRFIETPARHWILKRFSL